MKIQQVKRELYEIAKAYPTLLGLLERPINRKTNSSGKLFDGTTFGEHWAGLLKDLEPTHFENVCFEFATLKRPLPNPIDQLAFVIREQVKKRIELEEIGFEQHCEQLRYRLVKAGCSDARDWPAEKVAEEWKEKQTA